MTRAGLAGGGAQIGVSVAEQTLKPSREAYMIVPWRSIRHSFPTTSQL